MQNIAGYIAIAMSVIGFISVWIKLGTEKGRQGEVIDALQKRSEENKQRIKDLENKTHGLELHISEFMGEMRAKIDFIKEAVSEIKSRGGSRATKK